MQKILTILIFVAGMSNLPAGERPLMRDFMGINGHYHLRPKLYSEVCQHVRNYHNFSWDLGETLEHFPEYPKAHNKVDWDRGVYGKWKQEGFQTNACLMGAEHWPELAKRGDTLKKLGEEFAAFFGPGHRNLVQAVEIGNEPGSRVSDKDYFAVWDAMVPALRKGDPKLKIATCTVADEEDKYSRNLSEFKSRRDQFDIINIHDYAQLEGWPTWQRSYPEDPKLDYLSQIQRIIEIRDSDFPGKEVWVTEFGYDSCTPEAMKKRVKPFEKWESVSDLQQAQWIVRSFLEMSAMDLERAYLYFFNDKDKASVHAAAGITRNFEPKPSFHAMAHLYEVLGDYRFVRKVRADETLRLFEYKNDAGAVAWVLWSPTSGKEPGPVKLNQLPGKVKRSEVMALSADGPANPVADGKLMIGESPVFLVF